MTLRCLAIDWSGAREPAEQRRRIWIAEAARGRLVRLEGGRTRDDVTAWLVAEARRTPGLRVGLDFAFGFPAWFARTLGADDGPAVWRYAAERGEAWLRSEEPPFWGRREKRPGPADAERHWRGTDLDMPPVQGIRPKSSFQIGGAGAVGTATVRGMPMLRALRAAGFAVWPFDPVTPDAPAVLEIWPRALTGAVVKSNADHRRAYLATRVAGLDPGLLERAAASEDAFDAAIAALAMDRHAAALRAIAAAEGDARIEGRIWIPPATRSAPARATPARVTPARATPARATTARRAAPEREGAAAAAPDDDPTPLGPLAGDAPGDLPSAAFAAALTRVSAFVTRYLESPGQWPVKSAVQPGDVRRALPAAPPGAAESLDSILDDVERIIVPGLTHWNHPAFFNWFANSGAMPGVLGEFLAAALNVNGMLWRAAPAAVELEQLSLDWLRQLLGLGHGWFGEILDTASTAAVHALAAAREAQPDLAIRARGMAGRTDLPPLRVYASAHAHTSIDKAVITLGLGHDHLVKVPVDGQYRMRPDALEAAIAADRRAGRRPLAGVATVGTTATTAIDPVPEIAEIARAAGAWLHVVGAFGAAAAVVPEWRGLLDGVDLADSFVVNPHKWLFVPMDCSAFYVRRPEVLRAAFSLVPAYLRTDDGDAVNLMDYGFQLGRRFRALKLWMTLRAYGADGLAARIRHHVGLARHFADLVRADPDWRVMAPVPLSLAVVRYQPAGMPDAAADAANARLAERSSATGAVFLGTPVLDGRTVLRLAVGNIGTQRAHVERPGRCCGARRGRGEEPATQSPATTAAAGTRCSAVCWVTVSPTSRASRVRHSSKIS
ncbi:MAG: pyridoxal-dependent decarboxylase [Gemmatimonadota bacterium]